jgi:myo-inositol-hexaphosphate 3-phosphohydrolase
MLHQTTGGIHASKLRAKTEGQTVIEAPLGRTFPLGLFVVQNGQADPPSSTDPINRFEYDNSTQFKLLGWESIASGLGLKVAP